MRTITLAAVLAPLAGPAVAQPSTSFYDAQGRISGSGAAFSGARGRGETGPAVQSVNVWRFARAFLPHEGLGHVLFRT
jgi:hypothetical protein